MIEQTSKDGSKTEKPELVRQISDNNYSGSTVELTFGDSTFKKWAMSNEV